MTVVEDHSTAIAAVRAQAPTVEVTDDPEVVRRRSVDRSALLGPFMAEGTSGLLAEAVAFPTDEEQVVAIVGACARHGVPIVPRGAGTSNFGQSIPLHGGIVLDLGRLVGVLDHGPGFVRARAGTMLDAIDDTIRPHGHELRIHPSSKRMSTVAGFVVGGHGGIGSMRYGGLADLGNISGLRVVTAEPEPKVIELRGEETGLVQFSFGMAGVVTEVELATTTAWAWRDVLFVFDDLGDALRFGGDLTIADGLDVKNAMPMNAAMAAHLTPLAEFLPSGKAAALCMVAPHSLEGVRDLARRRGGELTWDVATGEGPRRFPGYEYTWGHAMWWLRKQQPTLAEALFLLPQEDPAGALVSLLDEIGEPAWVSSTCQRLAGHPAPQVALGIDGSVPGRLAEVAAAAEARDCLVINIHRPQLTEASIRAFGPEQRAFKAIVDPVGICNPGHLAEEPSRARKTAAEDLQASGWASRWHRDVR